MDIIAEGNYTAWWDKITDQYADESLRTDVKLIVENDHFKAKVKESVYGGGSTIPCKPFSISTKGIATLKDLKSAGLYPNCECCKDKPFTSIYKGNKSE